MTDSTGESTAARLLDAAILSLRTDVLALVGDDVGRMRVDHITRLLRMASAQLTRRQVALDRHAADAAQGVGIAVPPLDGEATPERRERRRGAIENAISAQLPALVEAAGRGDRESLRRLEAFVAFEKAFHVAQDADILLGSQVAYRGGRIDAEPPRTRTESWPAVDAPALTAYLRRHLGRENVHADGIRAIPGGFSKETVFFTLVDGASRRDLVMRKDMAVPFVDKTVTNEFGPLKALHALGFPVARPLWLETDTTVFGAPFLVSERVAGTSNAATWVADPVRAAKACRELAKILARLHRFSPAELGYPAERTDRSAGEAIEADIRTWERLLNARKRTGEPLQELPLVWLLHNIPAALFQRPARVVHGDVGFHNLMFDEHGDVTALLDWEFSVLGDPTQDLCFVRLFVEPLMPWPDFLALYAAEGGVEPCSDAMFFYDLWTKARNSIGCVVSRGLFDTLTPNEVKFALAGHIFGPYLQIEECEAVIGQLRQGLR